MLACYTYYIRSCISTYDGSYSTISPTYDSSWAIMGVTYKWAAILLLKKRGESLYFLRRFTNKESASYMTLEESFSYFLIQSIAWG